MPPPTAAPIHTLAYVVSECRQKGSDFFERYALLVRDGEHDPVTVAEIPELGPAQPLIGCRYWGHVLFSGQYSIERGGFTKLGVSPDGSTVVFEETDELSAVSEFHDFLTPEQKGIFAVRADGTGLRRLGPPAREPTYAPILVAYAAFAIAFSPDSRTIAFPDIGPGPAGEDAGQIFTMDLATGARKQITHLPPILPTSGPFGLPAVFGPIFLDNETIAFFTSTTTLSVAYTVKVDGTGLKTPAPPTNTGGPIVPRFAITGDQLTAFQSILPGLASGPPAFVTLFSPLYELFAFDGSNLLQLTNFGRGDTAVNGALVGPDEDHVFFTASADPFGTNPSENCQFFSIDRNGGDLRQLTEFPTTGHSDIGCSSAPNGPSSHGCAPYLQAQDAISGTLVFTSGCDLFGTNPSSSQIFAVRPDGSGLRQLTTLRGTFTDAEGAYHAELPSPFAYGPYAPGGTVLP